MIWYGEWDMNLPDALLLHNTYFMNLPYSHMVFRDILPNLNYLKEQDFIGWLQKLTGYRNLLLKSNGHRKRVEIHVCIDEDPAEDYILKHLRTSNSTKIIKAELGVIIICNTALAFNLEGPKKTLLQKYYQAYEYKDMRTAENKED